ncbi:MAG: hypothetical protein KC996_08925 [Phycisphaerales bacterium]|nr:hypothetical protein [Phycisphaerales bacterium]
MAFTTEQIDRLNTSFSFLKPRLGLVGDIFERSLLETDPAMSTHLPMDRVSFELNMLLICGHTADLELLGDRFAEMGEDLAELGIGADQFPAARDAMLRAFAAVSGYTWTQRLQDDWASVFNTVAGSAFSKVPSYHKAA